MTKSRYAFLLILLFGNVQLLPAGVPNSLPVSAVNTAQSIPKPFFFTENKGQWDSRVLYKCSAKNGMTWFLERDGITLLVSREQGTGNGERESDFGEQGSGNGEQGLGNGEQGNMRGRDITYGEPKRVPVAAGRGGLPRPPDAAVRQTLLSDDPFERDLPEMLRRHSARERYPMKSHALKFKFLKGDGSWVMGSSEEKGSFPKTQHLTPNTVIAEAQSIEAQGELPWHNNYFLGNDSSKWAPNCRNFSTVVYREVWDGIDIEWYENDGKLEFDFIVHPGFDPNQIRMSVEGLDSVLSLAGDGFWGMGSSKKIQSVNPTPNTQHLMPMTELRLQTSLGELRTALPSVYQISANGTRNEIDAAFELTDENTFGITLPSGHDEENTLRIDPLIYSTFLGGAGLDYGYEMISDGISDCIIIGTTLSANFPTTVGTIDTIYSGRDCFVTHLSNDGSQLLYSTFLGGSSDEHGYAITSDNNGGCIVTGSTGSTNFPVTNGTQLNGFPTDCFISRINSNGSQLVYSTYFGGSGGEYGLSIVNDGSGGCVVAGTTWNSPLPTTVGAYSRTLQGETDCFLVHMNNTASELHYCTYLGGSGGDGNASITDDGSGGVFVTGTTSSTDFPVTVGAFDASFNGGSADCFVTHLNSTGSQLIYSTFLGSRGYDFSRSLAFGESGDLVICGQTDSSDFPTTNGAYNTQYRGGTVGFVTRLNSTGSQLLFSTFLGGTHFDVANSVILDNTIGVIVVGSTSNPTFPVTEFAFDATYNGGDSDGFIVCLNATGDRIVYSSFLGGSSNEDCNMIVQDGSMGYIMLTRFTESSDFPTSNNAYDSIYNGGRDVAISRLHIDTVDVVLETDVLPLQYSLSQNYPNPFNSSTTISYSIPKPGNVELKLFDITGREVATLVNQKQQTGSYRVTFDGKNLSSGTYFVRMQAGVFVKTQKIVLLR